MFIRSNRHFTEEDAQMANEHQKRSISSYVICEFQIKMRYWHTPVRMVKMQKTDNTKCW